ncbi:hypothetical protein SAMN05216223_104129 [Actinacidiphila yanglinensis]|uniref:Glycoside hydrolase family 42 N-terminal domain-containing protein n=1 Tax=Actinacidiphila yanglinensis TaxID=310779 RepID=A0A1H5YSD3_9ACTN|nr:hypothetical protein [Actinacidiphila yanglinensis]SEG27099.1 hypothetical protein SAMN05216223_104129 [Actinacidiphila yanglinensis]
MSEQNPPASSGTSHAMHRRTLLQAAGLGAGVIAAGGMAAGRASAEPASAESRATEASSAGTASTVSAAASSADLPLTGGPDFPIGLFWPPHPYETTLDRYQEIADAGFTFLITGNYQFDTQSGGYALQMADQTGLKVLIAGDPRMEAIAQYMAVTDDRTVPSSLTTADATSWVNSALAGYSGHASFAGFNVFDEPAQSRFPTVAALTGILRQVAPGLLPYSNLVPGNGAGYAALLQDYIETVQPPLISFDRYPILTDGIDLNYFDNWAIYRDASLASGLPAWTYIQSVGYNNHRVPTAAELAWQVNISLAYGCKGIQYFTYWTPDPARGEGFTKALITVDGKQTPLYGAARKLNRGWLQPVGAQLKPLVSESVQHANDDPLPPSTVAFTPGDQLTAATGDASVLGLFRNPQDDGTRFLLVANRNPDAAASVQLGVNQANIGTVAQFAPATGTYRSLGRPATLRVELAAGGGALYRLSPR